MQVFDAIVLGLVEGVTEYLPVSSTGHLILVSRILGLAQDESSQRAIDTFNIAVQGAAVLAVAGLYRKDALGMVLAMLARIGLRVGGENHALHLRLVRNLVLSFVPAAIIGLALDDWLEEKFFAPGPVAMALLLGGIAMIALGPLVRSRAADGRTNQRTGCDLSVAAAIGVGLLQCVALFPGTSRSMMTIIAAMLVGLPPREAAKYSFLLALPTLGAACLYKSLGFVKHPELLDQLGGWIPVAVGAAVSFVSAALSVKWLVGFLGRGGFALFGWWRIGLAFAVGFALYQGWLKG